MHGDPTAEPANTATIAGLASDFAAKLGVGIGSPVDLDSYGAQYLAQARRETARARYEHECPAAMRESDWEHPRLIPNADAIATVRNWQYGPKGILATGPTGRGKTRAICDLWRRLACEEGREVRCVFATDWFAKLQQQVHYGRDDALGWVQAQGKVPILIMDDLGQQAIEKGREEWAMSWFFRLLDLRIGHGLPLIASTNLKAEQIAGTQDKRGIRSDPLLRRLLDLCEVVKFV